MPCAAHDVFHQQWQIAEKENTRAFKAPIPGINWRMDANWRVDARRVLEAAEYQLNLHIRDCEVCRAAGPYTIRPPLAQRRTTMPKRITRKRFAEIVAEIREKANRKEEPPSVEMVIKRLKCGHESMVSPGLNAEHAICPKCRTKRMLSTA